MSQKAELYARLLAEAQTFNGRASANVDELQKQYVGDRDQRPCRARRRPFDPDRIGETRLLAPREVVGSRRGIHRHGAEGRTSAGRLVPRASESRSDGVDVR